MRVCDHHSSGETRNRSTGYTSFSWRSGPFRNPIFLVKEQQRVKTEGRFDQPFFDRFSRRGDSSLLPLSAAIWLTTTTLLIARHAHLQTSPDSCSVLSHHAIPSHANKSTETHCFGIRRQFSAAITRRPNEIGI